MAKLAMIASSPLSVSRFVTASAPLLAFIVALPMLIIVASVFGADSGATWGHLWRTVLADYVVNSLVLMLGVGTLTLILGVPAAWYTAVCEFPGRRLFIWLLPLPLAFPAYIIAYTYSGLLDYPGPVQTFIRDVTGWGHGDYWFPPIRSLGGAIVMLGLVLYPYVFLLARASFLERSASALEVSRTLGYSVRQSFFRLALPLARPAIATGVSLALMETLADYGTVQYFGVSTFTTGIFRTFYGFDDITAASQLSAALLLFVVLLIFMERHSRRRARYDTSGPARYEHRIRLSGGQAVWAWVSCMVPVVLGFILPGAVLLKWALYDAAWNGSSFLALIWNSFYLAALAALIAVACALVLGYARRNRNTRLVRASLGVSGLGYAIPGAIVAIGVIVPLAWLDHRLIDLAKFVTGEQIGLVLSGSVVALLFAYTVRFLAISLGAVQNGLDKIKPSLDYATRSLGRRPIQVLAEIHVPLMRSTVLTALLIVFVDVMKELPATLILRPFDFNTLAVRAYELASDERLADAAVPSLMIVLVGVLPVILLSRTISRGHSGQE